MDEHNDEQANIATNGGPYSLQVHQATGMVSVQVGCLVDAALALLVEHAEKHNRTLDKTAGDVVERRLRFDGR